MIVLRILVYFGRLLGFFQVFPSLLAPKLEIENVPLTESNSSAIVWKRTVVPPICALSEITAMKNLSVNPHPSQSFIWEGNSPLDRHAASLMEQNKIYGMVYSNTNVLNTEGAFYCKIRKDPEIAQITMTCSKIISDSFEIPDVLISSKTSTEIQEITELSNDVIYPSFVLGDDYYWELALGTLNIFFLLWSSYRAIIILAKWLLKRQMDENLLANIERKIENHLNLETEFDSNSDFPDTDTGDTV